MSNAPFSYAYFGFNACGYSSQITPYYSGLLHPITPATTPDSFKDCVLACKISDRVHTNFDKRNVPQAASGNLDKK